MDHEKHMNSLIEESKILHQKIETAISDYNHALEETNKFLADCSASGLRKVSIEKRHESIPESMDFAFGAQGNVFGIGINDSRDESGWPAIWGVVKRSGYSGGCGNGNQYQIESGHSLIDGVYHLKGGKWMKIG